MPALLLILAWLGAVSGCAPAISTTLQQEAGPRIGFAEMAAQPDRYQDRLVILGGQVMSVQPWNAGSLLAVDQRALDPMNYPIGDSSGGTFLVESDQWLNSNYYLPKAPVTVAGVVKGSKDGVLLLKAREVHLWGPPTWEKYYYPVPREWYPKELEFWYTPPYWDIYRGGGRR
jgi:starvation-inducible outer membrane lipoprotein